MPQDILDKIKAKAPISLGVEGSETDLMYLVGSLLTLPHQISPKQSVAVVHPVGVGLPSQLQRNHELDENLKEIMQYVKNDQIVGIPISRGNGHWVYLRLSFAEGQLSQAELIDSRDEVDEIAKQEISRAIQKINPALPLTTTARGVQNPLGNIGTVNTCLDWVSQQAYLDLGIENKLTTAKDDMEIRQATCDLIKQNHYRHEVMFTIEKPQNRELQIDFDAQFARKLQAQYDQAGSINESVAVEQAFDSTAEELSTELKVEKLPEAKIIPASTQEQVDTSRDAELARQLAAAYAKEDGKKESSQDQALAARLQADLAGKEGEQTDIDHATPSPAQQLARQSFICKQNGCKQSVVDTEVGEFELLSVRSLTT